MRNKITLVLIIIVAILAVPIIGSGCTENDSPGNADGALVPSNAADALRFKEEHEFYNGQLRDNGEPHLEIYIPANNRVVYLEFAELMDFIDSGTGVFFFSRPT